MGFLKFMNWKSFRGETCRVIEGNWKNVSSALIDNEPRLKSEEVDEKEAEPQSAGDKEEAKEEEF